MKSQVFTVDAASWRPNSDPQAIQALEDGKVLYFPRLGFALSPQEQALLRPGLQAEGARNVSLDAHGRLKGVAGDAAVQAATGALISRFSASATSLVNSLFPDYAVYLRAAPASLRPIEVSTRRQSWRADDRRLHVDAFPSRPNRGERILRVFANINPRGASASLSRTWQNASCRRCALIRRCRPACWTSWASPNRCAANTTT